jgi:hypothetical protein
VHEGPRGHLHLDLRYLLTADGTRWRPAAGESPDVAWFDVEDGIGRGDGSVAAAIRARRGPLTRRTRGHQTARWSSVTPASSTSTGCPLGSGSVPRKHPIGCT